MPETTDDACRVRAVAALDLAGSPPQTEFEALAALAAQLLDCPIGMITLLDRDRQWVAASCGTDISQTPRSEAFCNYTIRSNHVMEIKDATIDPRFANVPLVTGPMAARAYAGLAVSARDPQTGRVVPVGAVCALDTHVRDFAAAHRDALTHLCKLTEALFAVRALKRQAEIQADHLRRSDQIFRQAERMAEMGSWRLDFETDTLVWSDGVYGIYDLPLGAPMARQVALSHFPAPSRAVAVAAMTDTMRTGVPFDLELDFVSNSGVRRRVQSVGELESSNGRPVALVGVLQDVTARHDLEESLRRSAAIDDLTGIANRAAFNEALAHWTDVARDDGTPLQLALIDLDRFKLINDCHGHLAGDAVLRAFGRRLQRVHAVDAFPARIGGDEFALILRGATALQAPELIPRLLAALKVPVRIDAGIIPVSGTIGYAPFDLAEDSLHGFIHRADSALYQAKRTKRGSARAWTPRLEGHGSLKTDPPLSAMELSAWPGQMPGASVFQDRPSAA